MLIINLDWDTLVIIGRHSVKLISLIRSYSILFRIWRVTFWIWLTQHSITYIFIILFVDWSGDERGSLHWILIWSSPSLLLHWLNCWVPYLRCSFLKIYIWDNTFVLIIFFEYFFIFSWFLHCFYTLLENIWFLFNSLGLMIITWAHRCILIAHSLS